MLIDGINNWSNIILNANASVYSDSSYSTLNINNDLTINDLLEIENNPDNNYSSSVRIRGPQTINGTGHIQLQGDRSELTNYGLDYQTEELTILGPDLTLQGYGKVSTNSSSDRWRILAPVIGDGGTLYLDRLDNNNQDLDVSTSSRGSVRLRYSSKDLALSVAPNSDVALDTSGSHSGLVIKGAGTTQIFHNNSFEKLTVLGHGRINGSTSSTTQKATISNDLTVDGTLELAAHSGGSLTQLAFTQPQIVDGTGKIHLSRHNAVDSASLRNEIFFLGDSSSVPETLTFAADLTLQGEGEITAYYSEDRLQILGTVAGETNGLLLERINNDGHSLTIDSSAGPVDFNRELENIHLQGLASSDHSHQVGFRTNDHAKLRNVTFDLDATLQSKAHVESFGGLTINGRFSFAPTDAYYFTILEATGGQTIAGTGTISLTNPGSLAGQISNEIVLDGVSSEAEQLVFGADLTIEGAGRLRAYDAEDSLKILGTLRGTADAGGLIIRSIDNYNATTDVNESIAIDASLGEVVFDGWLRRAHLTAVDGQTGQIQLTNNTILDDVHLSIDTNIGDGIERTYAHTDVYSGLTLDADLRLQPGPGGDIELQFKGSQVLDGNGRIFMHSPSAGASSDLWIEFNGQQDVAERFTIGSEIELLGSGRILSTTTDDSILLLGQLTADDGKLKLKILNPLKAHSHSPMTDRSTSMEISNSLNVHVFRLHSRRTIYQLHLHAFKSQVSSHNMDHLIWLLEMHSQLRLVMNTRFLDLHLAICLEHLHPSLASILAGVRHSNWSNKRMT